MEAFELMHLAIDVLTDLALNSRAPLPAKVQALREARPDLANKALDELACEVIESELARRKGRRAKCIGR
jgi:hypothetical protein